MPVAGVVYNAMVLVSAVQAEVQLMFPIAVSLKRMGGVCVCVRSNRKSNLKSRVFSVRMLLVTCGKWSVASATVL